MEIRAFSRRETQSAQFSSFASKMKGEDPFDLDIKTVKLTSEVRPRELITSKSLCTPGCGNTGTGNSYCCSCK